MTAELQRTDVDGIPAFWAPVPGTFRAALMFRVGTADESLPTRGITHLVEHLALFASNTRPFEANGFVDGERCVFYAAGEQEEVLAWLPRCAAALSDLPLDRLAAERRILRVEASGSQGGGAPARLLDMRFGAHGFGLTLWQELGLRWLGPEQIAGWARERFTRGNAALWMSAEPPPDLSLPLPDGPRRPPPPVEPMHDGARRRYLAAGTAGMAVSGLGARSTALTVAMAVAAERLYQRLRIDLGLVYDPYARYDALGRDHAHVMLGAECPDERAEQVAAEVWAVATELAEHGVTAEEIASHRTRLTQARAEPDAVLSELDVAASQELLGAPPLSTADVIAEVDALEPADPGRVLGAALESALLLIPAGASPLDGFEEIPVPEPEPSSGERFEEDPERGTAGAFVRVGDQALVASWPGSDEMTLRWSDIVLAERAPADALTLTARDSRWVRVRFSAMRQPAEAARAVRAHLPPDIEIPAGVAEAVEALDSLAAGLKEELKVAEILVLLPRELGDDEIPEALATYRAGEGRGLLALTNERLLRWHWTAEGSDAEALARSTIRGAELKRRRLRPAQLAVEAEKRLELVVDDADAAEALVERLTSGVPSIV